MVNGFNEVALSTAGSAAGQAAYEQAKKAQADQANEKLKALLLGQQAEKDAQNKVDINKKEIADSIQGVKDLNDSGLVNDGGAVTVKGVGFGKGMPDPTIKAGKDSETAIQKALANYNRLSPKLQSTAQAAVEGLDAANDPSQIGSMGQARTLMLKAMGMNRYNEKEAEAVLPASLRGYAAQIFNAGGGDASPIGESQRHAINQFFRGQLDNVDQAHQMLKDNSLSIYNNSNYFNPEKAKQLQTNMGAPVDKYLSTAKAKYAQLPSTQGPNLSAQPNPGLIDKATDALSGFFGGNKPSQNSAGIKNLIAPPQQQATPPGAMQAPQAPQRQVVKKLFSPSTKQTKVIYSDGTSEVQ